MSRTTIDSWLRSGRLIWAWPAVYAAGHMPTAPQARAYGAQLAAGDRAALAGWSAGAFYGVVSRWEPFELISPHRKRIHGLTIHHCCTLLGRDVWRFDGLRVTSPARTALDLAARVGPERLPKIVENLRLNRGRRLTLSALLDVVQRNPRHPGAEPLRQLLRVLGRHATARPWSVAGRRSLSSSTSSRSSRTPTCVDMRWTC